MYNWPSCIISRHNRQRHENKDLHGKVYINAGNDGNYTSKIELVNGDELNFRAGQGGSNIHFIGDRGSFDFNIVNFNYE